MFMRVGKRRFVNLSAARVVEQRGSAWYAEFGDANDPVELGPAFPGDVEEIVRASKATIVAAHSDEVLHCLFALEEMGSDTLAIFCEQHRIIAWKIWPDDHPTPVTAAGVETMERRMLLVQRLDGEFEALGDCSFQDL